MRKKKRVRFIVDVDRVTHTAIKIRAELRNMTIRNYILQAIAEKMVKEQSHDFMELYEH